MKQLILALSLGFAILILNNALHADSPPPPDSDDEDCECTLVGVNGSSRGGLDITTLLLAW